jgi:phosphoribosyl 1,2-cyclic phosphodiesterase
VLHFRSLASGSSGNSFLLRTHKAAILFDAGIRLSTLEHYLQEDGVSPTDLMAVLISHEHRDHCGAAADLAREHGVPIWANLEVLKAAGLHTLPSAAVLDVDRPTLFGDIEVRSFPVSHDAIHPVGFLALAAERTICIATDLGRATPEVAEAVGSADLVVLEANHDPEMLWTGSYPPHLRKRVAGPTGHLANEQCADILINHAKGDHIEVWLAHLSRNNNTATLALKTVGGMLRTVGMGSLKLGVARRDRPSLTWTGALRPTQLSLFSGSEVA